MMFLNLLMNPADVNGDILDDFLKLAFVQLTDKPTEFDVWLTEEFKLGPT